MLWAQDLLVPRYQRRVLVPGPSRVPLLPGPVGQAVTDVQRARMVCAIDPLGVGQQRRELVARGGRVPRLPGPVGQAGAGGQGGRVLGAQRPLPCLNQAPLDLECRGVIAAIGQVARAPFQLTAVIGKCRPSPSTRPPLPSAAQPSHGTVLAAIR